jgi:hypothetical protein
MANIFQVELSDSLENKLAYIVKQINKVIFMLEKQNEKRDFTELLTRNEICKRYNFSKATLDRRVADGSIKKILALGPRNPRYMLVVSASNSDTLN